MQDRRAAGNEHGAVDCLIRLGQLDDATIDARRVAASALAERAHSVAAARLILSVADLLTKDGRLPEALDALREAAQLNPGDLEIREKLAAATPIEPEPVEADPVPVDTPAMEIVTAVEESEIVDAVDPAAVLSEIAASSDSTLDEALPLESFFEELRGKVARDQEERAREQLDRGLEHLADSRLEEAIASLEDAARAPAVRFEASSHLARICLGRDDLAAAVDWMERALEAPAPMPDDRIAVMYDLADTLVRQGEGSRAMALFMEIESECSGYRDVRDRISHLAQAEIGKP
jgi:tetratricopeptide (TPR) repeat protein